MVVLGKRFHYHRYGFHLYNCFNKNIDREKGTADFTILVTTRLKVVAWLKSIRKQPSGGGFKLCLTCLLVFLVCFYTRILKRAISRYKLIRLCGEKKPVLRNIYTRHFFTYTRVVPEGWTSDFLYCLWCDGVFETKEISV